MARFLGLILLSFFIMGILLIPFIDFLYKIKFQRQIQKTKDVFNKRTVLFDKFHDWKVGTPFGGGILIIAVVSVLTLWAVGIFGIKVRPWEVVAVFLAFFGYGALGLYDDIKKIMGQNGKSAKKKHFGMKFGLKFILQWALAFIIATILYTQLGYTFIFIHGVGLASLGFLFIPFAAFIIVSFTNAFNIADGLDGLASGLLLICLIAFLAISSSLLDEFLGVYIAILIGGVAAFLYFNIYPARIWLGDVGSLSLGATLGVIGLLTGKMPALAFIGGVFILEVGSSLIQLLGKKFLKRKIFPVSPFHLYLQERGWEEPKIVTRMWLIGFLFATIGLYLAFIE